MKKYFLYFNGPLVACYLLYLHFWIKENLTLWGAIVAGLKASIFILFLPIGLLFMAYVFAVKYILVTGVIIFVITLIYLSYNYSSGSGNLESTGFDAVKEIVIITTIITLIFLALLKGSYLIVEFFGSFPTKEDQLYEYMR